MKVVNVFFQNKSTWRHLTSVTTRTVLLFVTVSHTRWHTNGRWYLHWFQTCNQKTKRCTRQSVSFCYFGCLYRAQSNRSVSCIKKGSKCSLFRLKHVVSWKNNRNSQRFRIIMSRVTVVTSTTNKPCSRGFKSIVAKYLRNSIDCVDHVWLFPSHVRNQQFL